MVTKKKKMERGLLQQINRRRIKKRIPFLQKETALSFRLIGTLSRVFILQALVGLSLKRSLHHSLLSLGKS